jgi:Peptidase C39 family
MSAAVSRPRRHLFIPEVVQTSAMDCGPAALTAFLAGHGLSVSYGRLREACQTDVDGTSIDMLETVAVQIGLNAEQILVPVDHLFLPETAALPALVVMRQPGGALHFVVAWRRHGRVVQIMDPGTGRRWPTCRRFLDDLYVHTQAVPAAAWRAWAETDTFLGGLRRRWAALGIARAEAERLPWQRRWPTRPGCPWRPWMRRPACSRPWCAVEDSAGVST